MRPVFKLINLPVSSNQALLVECQFPVGSALDESDRKPPVSSKQALHVQNTALLVERQFPVGSALDESDRKPPVSSKLALLFQNTALLGLILLFLFYLRAGA